MRCCNAALRRRSASFPTATPRRLAASPSAATARQRTTATATGLSAKRCGRFPFWCITVGHLALGTALFMINTHAIAHFVAVGYEKLAASFYFGLIGFIRIGATMIWGSLSDRLGRSKTYGVATLVTALGVACMIAHDLRRAALARLSHHRRSTASATAPAIPPTARSSATSFPAARSV